jgi:adenine-specific DNA-methyltransferase
MASRFVNDENIAQATMIQTLTNRQRKASLGQFFTPEPIARFMASMFEFDSESIELLDAGSGNGALSSAVVRSILIREKRPRRITITAYEIDSAVISQLNATLETCSFLCDEASIDFSYQVLHKDFILEAVDLTRGGLFAPPHRGFTAAIVNPPYKKIRSDSATRAALKRVGIETSNLYAGFVALIGRLLVNSGQLVAITPRSFCNGPYFRPFRRELLQTMAIHRIHTFESRSAAFRNDEVLQENVILHAVRGSPQPSEIIISSSSGWNGDLTRQSTVRYTDVVSPEDTDQFIRVTTSDEFARSESSMGRLRHTLLDLGLEVSTGRVVDFRARPLLRLTRSENTVPLIYPSHFNKGYVRWPSENSRKPNAIVENGDSKDLLVPSGIYVLVKRFSAKEERRRIVACLYDPSRVATSHVGFENHLNYFHVGGCGLSTLLAKGLTIFLNSTPVDLFFRQFSGHTQVNATDLRKLRYPAKLALERLGQKFDEVHASQQEIDQIVAQELA